MTPFDRYLASHHPGLSPDDLVPADSPGWWRVIGTDRLIWFAEPGLRDENGRAISPFQEWHNARQDDD